MKKRFRDYPQAIINTWEIFQRCQVSLVLNQNLFPKYPIPKGFVNSQHFLRHLVQQGAIWRYGKITKKIKERLEHELKIINQLRLMITS